MDQLIVQVAARSARSPEITKTDGRALRIGRAYDNDIVLADPFVSPHELVLACSEGHWTVQLLAKTNQVLVNGVPVRGESAAVNSGDRITVGRTDLSVFTPDHPIDPTRKLLLSAWIAHGRVGPWLTFGVLLAVCAIDMLAEFTLSSTDLKWKDYGYGGLFSVAIITLWAGLWAITGRVLRHQPYFSVQLLATSLVGFGTTFVLPLADLLEFITSSALLSKVTNYLMAVVFLTILLKLNLFFATNIRNTSRAALAISCVLVGLSYAVQRSSEAEFKAAPEYANAVKPPYAHIGGDRSIEDLMAAVKAESEKF
ncbi:MAG: FHA domain-containing protein [Gammaproteobacteria bacterium]|nr:FHA domain-containing protein [Gammaproteobacteria bacterium]